MLTRNAWRQGQERAAKAIRSDHVLRILWLFICSYSNFEIKIDLLYQVHQVVCTLLRLQMVGNLAQRQNAQWFGTTILSNTTRNIAESAPEHARHKQYGIFWSGPLVFNCYDDVCTAAAVTSWTTYPFCANQPMTCMPQEVQLVLVLARIASIPSTTCIQVR